MEWRPTSAVPITGNTGNTGVSDSGWKPSSATLVSSVKQTPKKNLLTPGFSGIPWGLVGKMLNLPSNIMGGSIKAGRESMTGEYKAPNLGQINIGNKQIKPGELIHPVFVGAYRGIRDNQTVMEELPKTLGVEPSSAPGLAIGLAGEVATPDLADVLKFGDIATTLVKKGGQPLVEGGKQLILKEFKPTQITKFAKETGEEMVDFLTRNKLTSNFVEEASSKIDDLQTAFDDIAVNSGRSVTHKDLFKSFAKRIDELNSSVVPQMKSKSKDIKQVFNNLVKKYQVKTTEAPVFDVGDLTKERRNIDKVLKESSFNLPAEQATYLRGVRDSLQEAIQGATSDIKIGGRSLKEIGNEMHKFINFKDIAEKQVNTNKGSNLFGLIKTVATMGGGYSLGGIPGIGIGYLGSQLAQNPKAVGLLSQYLQAGGKKIQNSKVLSKILEEALRVGKEGTLKINQYSSPAN